MALDRPLPDLPELPGESESEESTARRLEAAGFRDPGSAAGEWRSFLRLLPPETPFREFLSQTWSALSRSADPDLSLRQLCRWIEMLLAEREGSAMERASRRWERSPLFRESMVLLLGVSPALGEDLLQNWEDLAPDSWSAKWDTPASIRQRLSGAVPPEPDRRETGSGAGGELPEGELLRALKRFQRMEEIRIAFLDECLRLPAEQVTLQISWVADVLVQRCLDRALQEVGRRHHTAPPAAGFVIFALGKLGGLELNYSSDIDLNFVMTDEASVASGDGSTAGAIPDLRIFFTRVAEKVIDLLSRHEAGPPLYRVDTRLRPDGSQGRLVWTVRASLDYYHSVGRTWERLALIRLRPLAGDFELAREFQAELDAFIFRKLLTQDALEDLQNLKSQIESLAPSAEDSASRVKVGHGGIRDVEFIIQHFQLIYGANHPDLKHANVFDVLDRLRRHRILDAGAADSLGIGYRLLRQVENRIQLGYRLQADRLPAEGPDLRRIARGLGFRTTDEFRGELDRARARIRTVFRRLFESAATEESLDARLASLLELPLDVVKEEGARFLEPYGFRDPVEAFRVLRAVGGERASLWDKAYAEKSFRRVAPALLGEVSRYLDPDRTLFNFSECVSTLGARSVFFDLLHESRDALRKTVEICGHSSYLVEILRKYPGLFDEVIDSLRTGFRVNREELMAEARRLASQEDRTDPEILRSFFEFKQLHILVIAFRDMERQDNLTTTMFHISRLAEAVLHGVLTIAERETRKRLGDPVPQPGEPAPAYLVLGLGKLGGEEMNYRSDLDLVFLYRGKGSTTRGLTIQEYFTDVAQRLFASLKKAGPLGVLWDSDPRLRPMGSKNVLAISFDEWRNYFERGTARTWERQAFLRARPVAGDADLAAAARDYIAARIPLRPGEDPVRICREVREMRQRLEESVPRGDVKRGRGGIVDVEFIVQTLQLIHGREHPDILATNTAEGVRRLMKRGFLDSQAGSELLSAYQFMRWLETRFSLLLTPEESIGSLDQERLRSLIQRIGYRSSGAEAPENIFLDELRYHCDRNRHHLEAILERAG